MIAGYDDQTGPHLYFCDYLASLLKLPFAVHGYGSYMTLSVLDRGYRANMTMEEGMGLLKQCIAEIQKRFIVNLARFRVRYINKDGLHDLPDIVAEKAY